jgi:hypothetical protein
VNIENLNHNGKYATMKGSRFTLRERSVKTMTPVDVALALIDCEGFEVDLSGLKGLPAEGKLTCAGASLLMDRLKT